MVDRSLLFSYCLDLTFCFLRWLLFPTLLLNGVSSRVELLFSLQTFLSWTTLLPVGFIQPKPTPELPTFISNHLLNISSWTFYSCLKSHVSKTDLIIHALLLPTTGPCSGSSAILSLSVNDITSHLDIPMETSESPLTPPSPSSKSVSVNSSESFKSLSLPSAPLCPRSGSLHLSATIIPPTHLPALDFLPLYKQ